jgi:hypothetical protein
MIGKPFGRLVNNGNLFEAWCRLRTNVDFNAPIQDYPNPTVWHSAQADGGPTYEEAAEGNGEFPACRRRVIFHSYIALRRTVAACRKCDGKY